MTYCKIRQAGGIFAVIGCVLVQPAFGADRLSDQGHQATPRDGQRQKFQRAHDDRYAQLNKHRQKIAQLKQSIEKDHQRVADLRRQLRHVRAEITQRRGATGAAVDTNKIDPVAVNKHRSKMAALKKKMDEAVEAHDDQRAEALRRKLSHLKRTQGQRRDVHQVRASQRQEMIRRFEEKIRIAKESYQLDRAEALQTRLERFKASVPAKGNRLQADQGKRRQAKRQRFDRSRHGGQATRRRLVKEARDSEID